MALEYGCTKFATFAMRILKIYIMTQMILNIENPDIIPSLAVLESIATAYKEVTEAHRTGRKLPSLNSLIEELKVQ